MPQKEALDTTQFVRATANEILSNIVFNIIINIIIIIDKSG
jgi:hypothetical protein